jgi:hypothetical protein
MVTAKIWVLATVMLASFFYVEARADDNLDCAGSLRRLGESNGPVLRAPHVTTRIDPHAAGVEACAAVPKADSVEWIRCAIAVNTRVGSRSRDRHRPSYTCKMGEPCFGQGSFDRAFRRNLDQEHDQLCVVYSNSTEFYTDLYVSFQIKGSRPPRSLDVLPR